MLNPRVTILLAALVIAAIPSIGGFVIVERPSTIISSARRPILLVTANSPRRYGCLDSLTSTTIATTATSSSSSLYAITTNSSRRIFVEKLIATTSIAILSMTTTSATIPFITPQAANAKEEAGPTTRQTVSDAFNAIRTELTSPTGLISTLTNLINNNSYPEIMQYTKESDAYFRKAKLGKARKLLTDNTLKGDAILMSNAVTFDLIGINRASRPGQENREEQIRYLNELRKDIERFLELESTIVIAGE